MLKIIIFFFSISVSYICYSQNLKIFSYKQPPEDTTLHLCHTDYYFLDSSGYFISGCENHLTFLGKFIYIKDSSKVSCDFVPYPMYNPLLKTVKRNIPNKKDITVRVFDMNGKPCNATVGIVGLRRKRDTIISEYTTHEYAGPITFPNRSGKKTFWTLSDLFPIFFAELHFPFDKKNNYYELYIDLPFSFFYVTEGKIWVNGLVGFSVINEKQLAIGKDVYECDEY